MEVLEERVYAVRVALDSATSNSKINVEHLVETITECFSLCPIEMYNEKILSLLVPIAYMYTSKVCIEAFNVISCATPDSLDIVKEKLTFCKNSLKIWKKCVEEVARMDKASVASVKTLLDTLPITVEELFKWCKSNEKKYGTVLKEVSEDLADFFHQTYAILKLFLTTLENVIVFDTDVKSETMLLLEVVNRIGAIAVVSNGMDLKTLVETFKAFGSLALTYRATIEQMCPMNIMMPLRQMAEVTSGMLSRFEECSNYMEERTIKATSLLLKIIGRLYEAYSASLEDGSLFELMELLVRIHKYSSSYLATLEIDENLIQLINDHITSGAEPLLNTVFQTDEFRKAYFLYAIRENVDNLGYHVLTVRIMKKLMDLPVEHQLAWNLPRNSLLDNLFSNIDCLQNELVGDIKLPIVRVKGEMPRLTGLYEVSLVTSCALISRTPPSDFHRIEIILLKYLLSGQFWSSLLSSDVWCFVDRIGPPELCENHVKYLMKVYSALSKRNNDMEAIVLHNLIGRLYNTLPDQTKHKLVVELENPDIHFIIPISKLLLPETKTFLAIRMRWNANKLSTSFEELSKNSTAHNWIYLKTLLTTAEALHCTTNDEYSSTIIKLWNFVAKVLENSEDRILHGLSEFIVLLLRVSGPDKILESKFSSVLKILASSCLYAPAHVKLKTSHFLEENSKKFTSEVAGACAELITELLQDEDPIVRQESLESFDHVAHICPDDSVVTKIASHVNQKSTIAHFVRAYLGRQPLYKLKEFPNARFYVRHLVDEVENTRVAQVCRNCECSEKDEKISRWDEPLPTGGSVESANSLDSRIYEICSKLNEIIEQKDDFSDAAMEMLRTTFVKILDIK